MAWDSELTGVVLDVFIRTISAWYRAKARKLSAGDPRCAAVTVIQRAGEGLALSPHFHALFADGAWSKVGDDWAVIFDRVAAPTDDEVIKLCAELRRKVLRKLIRTGVIARGGDGYDELAADEPLLAECDRASLLNRVAIGERKGKLLAHIMREPPTPKPRGRRCAFVDGFSLHASTWVAPKARPPSLERLVRYIARPVVCGSRLERPDDGRILMKFKRTWSNGATARVWEPLDFISKLVPLVVKPRLTTASERSGERGSEHLRCESEGRDSEGARNLLRYHGQWAARGAWRDEICPTPRQPAPAKVCEAPTGNARRRRISSSELLRRCFAADVLTCRCGGVRELISLIDNGKTTTKILAHIGKPTEPPRFRSARAPPQAEFDE